jgi:hypothetical protein
MIEQAVVIPQIMSDGSVAFNVEYIDAYGQTILTAGCADQLHAQELRDTLNRASWVQA